VFHVKRGDSADWAERVVRGVELSTRAVCRVALPPGSGTIRSSRFT
jgi:hypothetical protein